MSFKNAVIASAIYVFIVTLVTFATFYPFPFDYHTFKELLFGYWGYGWDGMHYIRIATRGYHFPLQAFFPLYPLFIKLIDVFLPLSLAQRLNIPLLPVMLYLSFKLVSRFGVTQNQVKTALLILALPPAFFLQANYTETFFIVLATIGLMFLINNKHLPAAVFAGLLSATKSSGVVLGIVVVAAYFFENFPRKNIKDVRSLLTTCATSLILALISFSGLFLYLLYLNQRFGSYQTFFTCQNEWNRNLTAVTSSGFFTGLFTPLIEAIRYKHLLLYLRVSEILAVLLNIILLKMAWGKIDLKVWTFCLLLLILPVITGSLLSFNRLFLLEMPLLIWGANKISMMKKSYVYWLLLLIFGVLQAWGIYLFYHGTFVG